MKPITVDEIKRRIQREIYTKRRSIVDLVKESGFSELTIKKAAQGIVGESDQKRFTRYFEAKDAGRILGHYYENRNPVANSLTRERFVAECFWIEKQLLKRGHRILGPKLMDKWPDRQLRTYFHSRQKMLKRIILDEYEELTGRRPWFPDKWPIKRWVEAIDLAMKDRPIQ